MNQRKTVFVECQKYHSTIVKCWLQYTFVIVLPQPASLDDNKRFACKKELATVIGKKRKGKHFKNCVGPGIDQTGLTLSNLISWSGCRN